MAEKADRHPEFSGLLLRFGGGVFPVFKFQLRGLSGTAPLFLTTFGVEIQQPGNPFIAASPWAYPDWWRRGGRWPGRCAPICTMTGGCCPWTSCRQWLRSRWCRRSDGFDYTIKCSAIQHIQQIFLKFDRLRHKKSRCLRGFQWFCMKFYIAATVEDPNQISNLHLIYLYAIL